jgi:hypothetical protein
VSIDPTAEFEAFYAYLVAWRRTSMIASFGDQTAFYIVNGHGKGLLDSMNRLPMDVTQAVSGGRLDGPPMRDSSTRQAALPQTSGASPSCSTTAGSSTHHSRTAGTRRGGPEPRPARRRRSPGPSTTVPRRPLGSPASTTEQQRELRSERRKPPRRRGFSVAVPVGFEPTVELPPHMFSRHDPSAARTRYRERVYTIREAPGDTRHASPSTGAHLRRLVPRPPRR